MEADTNTSVGTDQKKYLIANEDIKDLTVKYDGRSDQMRSSTESIDANYVTREISNGSTKRSKVISSSMQIEYNAKAPIIMKKTA